MRNLSPGIPATPVLLVVCGDIDPATVLTLLENAFGALSPATRTVPALPMAQQKMDVEVVRQRHAAQERLAYLVRAPGPGEADVTAWQMALYILSHGDQGRLGREAIGRQGLVYYIDSTYRTDGRNGWLTLEMGVDPENLAAMKALLRQELRRLEEQPPSRQEIDEARQHLLGRYVSAAQSNPELTDDLARQWLWYGHLMDYEDLEHRLEAVRREDIVELLPALIAGTTVSIRNPAP